MLPMGMELMTGGVRRDAGGNRLRLCSACGRWKRAAESFPGGADPCGACRILRGRRASSDMTDRRTRELSAADIAELRARVEAARRLKAARCGETIGEGEIEAEIGGGR